MNPESTLRKTDRRIWFFIGGILFIGFFAISNQSLWIDEVNTALKSEQGTLSNWWHEMVKTRGSDMQMPLYMIWIWICGRIFGSSEIAVRAVNLLWFVPGVFMLWCSLARQRRLQSCVFLAVVLSPFAWYYLDEARPYAMQIGASLCLLAAIIHWNESEDVRRCKEMPWVIGFALGLIALCGASMLGVIWAGAAILALIFILRKERLGNLARNFFPVWLGTLLLLVTMGVYFAWTLKFGARASDIGTTNWKNAAFVMYELLGFSGLGPGRLEIRGGQISVFTGYVPELAAFAILTLLVLFFAGRGFWEGKSKKSFIILATIVSLPVLFLLGTGVALHFRVLGRHFAPLFAVVVFVLGNGLVNLWQRGTFGRIIALVYLFFCVGSCLAIRFESRHQRDDYRDAAAMANQALVRGETVWWDADANGAKYYHLPLTTDPATVNAARQVVNLPPDFLMTAEEPEMVCCSRPDLYDPKGYLAQYLAQKNFQKQATLPAFVIWVRNGR